MVVELWYLGKVRCGSDGKRAAPTTLRLALNENKQPLALSQPSTRTGEPDELPLLLIQQATALELWGKNQDFWRQWLIHQYIGPEEVDQAAESLRSLIWEQLHVSFSNDELHAGSVAHLSLPFITEDGMDVALKHVLDLEISSVEKTVFTTAPAQEALELSDAPKPIKGPWPRATSSTR